MFQEGSLYTLPFCWVLVVSPRTIPPLKIQQTQFDSNFSEGILSKVYKPFSTYFDSHAKGVFWLIHKTLLAISSLIFADLAGTFCMLYVTRKNKAFCFIAVYGPNPTNKLIDFFQHIEPFVMSLWLVIFAGDWNAILDLKID